MAAAAVKRRAQFIGATCRQALRGVGGDRMGRCWGEGPASLQREVEVAAAPSGAGIGWGGCWGEGPASLQREVEVAAAPSGLGPTFCGAPLGGLGVYRYGYGYG
jgi:hypothetical protein